MGNMSLLSGYSRSVGVDVTVVCELGKVGDAGDAGDAGRGSDNAARECQDLGGEGDRFYGGGKEITRRREEKR